MKSFLGKLLNKFQKHYNLYSGAIQIRKHGIWYVDIPRTSSTSIKAELGIIYGPPYGKANLVNKQKWADKLPKDYIAAVKHQSNKIFNDHIPAIEMKKIVGEKAWKSIFTFTFVRNPWGRIVSLYFAMKKWGEIPDDMQFRDYILALRDDHNRSQGSIFRLPEYYLGSSDYVLDANGGILVDFIGKFENRTDDLKIVAQKLGRSKFGILATNLSKSRNRNYTEYYDQETREIVRKIYGKDIELFDYEFESKK